MEKPTAPFAAPTLALGAANLVHTTDTTAAPGDSKPMIIHHKGDLGQHDMMSKSLNPTDVQEQQTRDIMKSQREDMKYLSLDGRRTMHDLTASDTFDKAKTEAQIDKMGAQHKAMALSRLETQNEIYNILTPEQKKQFNANFREHLTECNAPVGRMSVPAG